MVWIVNHGKKIITRLHSYLVFVTFLDINLKSMRDSQSGVPTVSNEKACSRKLGIVEFLAKREILNDINGKNLLDNVFQTEERFTLPTKQLHGCFRSFNFKLWKNFKL